MPKEDDEGPPKLKHTRREIRSFKSDLWKLWKHGTELDFMRFLRGIGIKDEAPRFGPLVKAFRDWQKTGKL